MSKTIEKQIWIFTKYMIILNSVFDLILAVAVIHTQ